MLSSMGERRPASSNMCYADYLVAGEKLIG